MSVMFYQRLQNVHGNVKNIKIWPNNKEAIPKVKKNYKKIKSF